MNCVSVSFSNSKVFIGFDTIAVRCAYLLGDNVLFAGDVNMGVYADHYFSKQHDTLKSKIQYLIVHSGKNPIQGISINDLNGALQTFKFYRSLKHLTPQQIIAEKKFERSVDKIYDGVMKPYLAAFQQSGLTELSHLVDNGIKLGEIDNTDRELQIENKEAKGYLKLSTVLKDRFNPENPNDVYLATHEFEDFVREQKLSAGSLTGDKVPDADAKILSAPLLKFPAINQFKASELQSVRKNIHAANAGFRKQMNEWSKALRSIAFEPRAWPAMQQTFQQQITPHIQSIQEAVDADERIELSHRANNHNFEMIVTLHVCSVNIFWQYLTWANSLGLETLQVLGAQPDFEKNSQTSCLILECNHRNLEQKTTQEKFAEQPVLSRRKTLEID